MNTNLVTYYKNRAAEYENIYHKPERQSDLLRATGLLQNIFHNKNSIEIACGTGYWTERMAATAKSILATDINDTVLEIAKHKQYPNNNVQFEKADFNHWQPAQSFEALFGGFIWSHIPVEELNNFIRRVNHFLTPGSTMVFMDNNYVEGSSTPLAFTDKKGNTYQDRKLKDGSVHRVLKNFPTEEWLKQQVHGMGTVIDYIALEYFWIVIYTTV
jgi:trans-aconitate methyltransferase